MVERWSCRKAVSDFACSRINSSIVVVIEFGYFLAMPGVVRDRMVVSSEELNKVPSRKSA
jgi:hypothetical protein